MQIPQHAIVINQEIYSSKNSRQFVRMRNGRTILLKSHRAKEQEDTLKTSLQQQANKWAKMAQGEAFPLTVCFCVWRKTKRHWDWQNIIQGLADAMVAAGYIPDDDTTHFTPKYILADYDKENPRVAFWIEKKLDK